MSEVGKKLKTALEGYAKFLRDRDLAPQSPITPGSMGPGVPAIRGGAWRLHVRADARPVAGRNWQTLLHLDPPTTIAAPMSHRLITFNLMRSQGGSLPPSGTVRRLQLGSRLS